MLPNFYFLKLWTLKFKVGITFWLNYFPPYTSTKKNKLNPKQRDQKLRTRLPNSDLWSLRSWTAWDAGCEDRPPGLPPKLGRRIPRSRPSHERPGGAEAAVPMPPASVFRTTALEQDARKRVTLSWRSWNRKCPFQRSWWFSVRDVLSDFYAKLIPYEGKNCFHMFPQTSVYSRGY